MSELGHFALVMGFAVCAYSISLALVGYRKGRPEMVRSAENGVLAVFGLVTLAVVCLEYLMFARDFNVEYVAAYTSRALSPVYTATALWGGQKGSLLFWLWLLCIYSAAVVLINRVKHRQLMPFVVGVTMLVGLFFHTMLLFAANPFERLSFTPIDGNGLNPLLQNPGMVIHPVCLYLGFVGMTIPFSFAIGALATRQLGVDWIRSIRRWTIVPWLFLTVGVILGGKWAYVELGWGGYWAWDPVENASILPWFTSTAFLHSVMIQEKRGMLKIWNMVLIITTFLLTIFGTFLTRSGVLSSVHTFTQSSIGPMFFTFLFIMMAGSLALLFSRLGYLRSENRLESFVSRESTFLFNNLILVGACFSVLWGTIFPLVSEAVRGVKITVGAPFFNQINVPIGLALLCLTGLCTMIAWRKASLSNFQRNVMYPLSVAIIGVLVLLAAGIRHFYALVTFGIAFFTAMSIFIEFYRGTAARRRMTGESILQAFNMLVGLNKRRYGGYIVHFGIVVIFIGITGSSVFQTEEQIFLEPQKGTTVGRYHLLFTGLRQETSPGLFSAIGEIDVFAGGRKITTMRPEKRMYKGEEQPHTEVAIHSTFTEDLYIILAAVDESGGATFKVFVNPLVRWIWIGGLIIVLGAGIAIAPDIPKKHLAKRRRRERATVE